MDYCLDKNERKNTILIPLECAVVPLPASWSLSVVRYSLLYLISRFGFIHKMKRPSRSDDEDDGSTGDEDEEDREMAIQPAQESSDEDMATRRTEGCSNERCFVSITANWDV